MKKWTLELSIWGSVILVVGVFAFLRVKWDPFSLGYEKSVLGQAKKMERLSECIGGTLFFSCQSRVKSLCHEAAKRDGFPYYGILDSDWESRDCRIITSSGEKITLALGD